MKTFKTKQTKKLYYDCDKMSKNYYLSTHIYNMYICIYAQNYFDCELFHPSAVYPLHQFTKRESNAMTRGTKKKT